MDCTYKGLGGWEGVGGGGGWGEGGGVGGGSGVGWVKRRRRVIPSNRTVWRVFTKLDKTWTLDWSQISLFQLINDSHTTHSIVATVPMLPSVFHSKLMPTSIYTRNKVRIW